VNAAQDRGVVLVWVALLITALVGVGALVIDIGALYVEKRQLQNGADAAALAVAQDCAGGDCGSYASEADSYADLNAKDGAAAVDEVCGSSPLPSCTAPPEVPDGALGWVQVRTSTESDGGGNQIGFLLAPVMNAVTGETVNASAVAAWGTLGTAHTFPFTFSECIFKVLGGDLDPDNPHVPTGLVTLYSKAGTGNSDDGEVLPHDECGVPPGGGTAAGNFGWLNVETDDCLAEVTVDGTVGGDTGASVVAHCDLPPIGATVVVPIYESVTGTGTNAVYTIAGFAGFTITGYDLPGVRTFTCGGPVWCIQGRFTAVVAPGEFGGGSNYGAVVVKMVG
jgi:Putative Flp pilus-assembly TadE/G-like